MLLDESSDYTPEMTDSLAINNKIKEQLKEILVKPETTKYDLEKAFKGTDISVVHSKDKRLWLFTWYENTGGSFISNLTVIQYRTKTNKPKVVIDNSITDDEVNGFDSSGSDFEHIIKLPSKSKNLYLCLGGFWGCNTCSAQVALVIELTSDGINLGYPAFKNTNVSSNNKPIIEWEPMFIMDSRSDDIKTFAYDAKTQSIRYKYVPDDNTPITVEDEKYDPNAKPIVGYLKWDGTEFIETVVGQ